jgi:hypothetical protein
MRRYGPRPIEPLGKLLEKALPRSTQLVEARLFGAFIKAVPERVLANARPVRFQNGVLWVNTKNASWAHELEYLAAELLPRIRARLSGTKLIAIRFRVGPLPDLPDPIRELEPPVPAVPLTSLPEDLGRALASLRNDELRSLIASAARHAMGPRKKDG